MAGLQKIRELTIDTMIPRNFSQNEMDLKTYYFYQGDINSAKFLLNITHEGAEQDLSTATKVQIAFLKPDGKRVFQDCSNVNSTKGKYYVVLNTQSITTIGNVVAQIRITFPDTVIETTKFVFSVAESIMSDEAVESSDEFPAIQKAIEAGEKLEGKDIDGIIAAGLKADTAINQIGILSENVDVTFRGQQGLNRFFAKLNRGESATLVFLGDSTTEDNDYSLKEHVTLVREMLQSKYGTKAIVLNKGIGGHKSTDGVSRFFADVINQNPDAIVICFGINDSSVDPRIPLVVSEKANRDMIESALTYCGEDIDIIFRTMNLPRNFANPSIPYFKEYNDMIKRLCDEYGLIFADLYSYMEKLGLTQETIMKYYYDSIHPNDEGHKLIFDFLKSFITSSEKHYKKKRNFDFYKINGSKVVSNGLLYKNNTDDRSVNYPLKEFYESPKIASNLTYEFIGTEVAFYYLDVNWASSFKVYLDGVEIETIAQTNPLTNYSKRYVLKGLTDGKHTLKIDVLETKTLFLGGFHYKTKKEFENSMNLAGLLGFVPAGNLEHKKISGIFTLKDKITGFLIQGGFSSCDKGGFVNLAVPYTQSYNVIVTQSGGGGQANPTYENVYFTAGADYSLDKFKPYWASADAKKGLNWIAFGI